MPHLKLKRWPQRTPHEAPSRPFPSRRPADAAGRDGVAVGGGVTPADRIIDALDRMRVFVLVHKEDVNRVGDELADLLEKAMKAVERMKH